MAAVAGIEFQADGAGQVLTGVVGPEPATGHPHLRMPLAGLSLADLPLHRWDHHPTKDDTPDFVLDDPPIYVGTTELGLHIALIGVRDRKHDRLAVGLLHWTDEIDGAGLFYYWPTIDSRPSVRWSHGGDTPAENVMLWFPLPEDTAHVELRIDGVVVETVRPTSRVAVLHSIPDDAEIRHVLGIAYDTDTNTILTTHA